MAKPNPIEGVDPDGSLLANAAIIIPARVTELTDWEECLEDESQVEKLHAMRISAKRIRYTLEAFAPYYGEEMRVVIRHVKALQEHLGEIHDADVLVPPLEAHIVSLFSDQEASHKRRRKNGKKAAAPVGVHLHDLDAAAGLLSICRAKRDERDARFLVLKDFWSNLREERVFETLCALVRLRAAEEARESALEQYRAEVGPTIAADDGEPGRPATETLGGGGSRRGAGRKVGKGGEGSDDGSLAGTDS
jgi:hypothetical protein